MKLTTREKCIKRLWEVACIEPITPEKQEWCELIHKRYPELIDIGRVLTKQLQRKALKAIIKKMEQKV